MLSILAGFALVFFGLVTPNGERHVVFGLGILAPGAFGLPVILSRRPLSFIEPTFLLLPSIIVGTTLGASFIAYGMGPRWDLVTNGEPYAHFINGGIWILVSLTLVGIGSCLPTPRIRLEEMRLFQDISVSPSRLTAVIAVAIPLVWIMSGLLAVSAVGGDLDAISRKRDLEGGDQGLARVVSALNVAIVAFVAASAFSIYRRMPLKIAAALVVLIAGSVLIPFVSSQRGQVMNTFIALFIVAMVYDRLKLRSLVVYAVVVLVAFSAMTSLRQAAQGGELSRRVDSFNNPIVALGAAGNGLSISGTSHILGNVPERMDYLYGSSFFSWLSFPVPRSLWPDKPDISLGKMVKEQVLGQTTRLTGRPPSLMAEGYMNFGIIGYLMISLLFGVMIRAVWDAFRPLLANNKIAVVLYVSLMPFVYGLMNANFSRIIILMMFALLPLVIVLYLIRFMGMNRSRSAFRLEGHRR